MVNKLFTSLSLRRKPAKICGTRDNTVRQKPLILVSSNIKHRNPITGGAARAVPGENHAIPPVRRADLRRDGLLNSEEGFIVKDHGGRLSPPSMSSRSRDGDQRPPCPL